MKRFLTFSLALLVGCADDAPPYCSEADVSATTVAIANAKPSASRLSAAVIHDYETRGRCSAVVVGAFTVITSAHCIDVSGMKPGRFAVSVIDAEDPTLITRHEVYEAHHTPSRSEWQDIENDIAVVHVTPSLPQPFARPYFPERDRERCSGLLAQGYGINGDGEYEGLREREASVVWYSDKALASDAGVCSGDSGGPLYALVDGELLVAGLHSTGECGGASWHTSVAAHWRWIAPQVY